MRPFQYIQINDWWHPHIPLLSSSLYSGIWERICGAVWEATLGQETKSGLVWGQAVRAGIQVPVAKAFPQGGKKNTETKNGRFSLISYESNVL